MITIRKPLCFSEIGRKENQEDYLFPSEATNRTRVFIMCDGMGGHDNGEVASATAATALGEYLTGFAKKGKMVDIPRFEAGLAAAYDALDAIDTNSAKKPGTTLTCLCLNKDSYLVAHIGDSRIYHIRPSLFNKETRRGGILYQSSDHSLVNDLLQAGEISEEEAKVFPQKNVITRAMQPHLPKRYKADVFLYDDIQEGDYFFLCCDGVLEQLSNEDLCSILADEALNDAQKLSKIKAVCDGRTRDNYTCWLVPVDKVSIDSKSEISEVINAEVDVEVDDSSDDALIGKAVDTITVDNRSQSRSTEKQPLSNKEEAQKRKTVSINIPIPSLPKLPDIRLKTIAKWLISIIAAILIIGCLYTVYKYFTSDKDITNKIEQILEKEPTSKQ